MKNHENYNSLYSLERSIEWKRDNHLNRGVGDIASSLLAREINWMETRWSISSSSLNMSFSLLAREINWMETVPVSEHQRSSAELSLYSLERSIEWKLFGECDWLCGCLGSLLARVINWMETVYMPALGSQPWESSLLAREINWMETSRRPCNCSGIR